MSRHRRFIGRSVHTLRLGGDGVIVLRDQRVDVTNRLEQYVSPFGAFNGPEDATVLEPRVGEDSVDATKHVGEMAHGGLRTSRGFGTQSQTGGEVFWRAQDVGCPVQRVVAIVNCTAALGRVVDRTEVLPL